MTAFEILLNKFFETIENNEPKSNTPAPHHRPSELSHLIKDFIDTSFLHGENLDYQHKLSNIMQKSGNILQNTSHEEWSKIKYAFMQNDLHIIRRDRGKEDIRNLKMKLDQIF